MSTKINNNTVICMMNITEDPRIVIPDGFIADLIKLNLQITLIKTFAFKLDEIKLNNNYFN